jgi:2-hydroxy-3-oxopropionate reductase
MAETIGFIGLGIMGAPMARNLLRAGHRLVVHNRTPAKAHPLAEEGAELAGSPRAVAERSDVVITMLPDSPDVERVVAGPDGVLEGIRKGALLVDMSTISPGVTRALAARLAERGASMLDAPVSGGDVGAINATLTIMVGGDARDFARARPLFDAMGKHVVHVGAIGAGQVTKAANQVVVGLVIAAVAEGLVLGSRGGVPPETILDVLGTGLAGNRVMELKREKLLTHVFKPGFRAELHLKDLGIALAEAHESGAALPVTALVETLFARMKEQGWGAEDHSGLLKVIESFSDQRTGSQ